MFQWKTSSVIHATSVLPGTNLSISQLIRIERHRGSSYTALHAPHHEQNSTALDHGVIGGPSRTFSQDDGGLSVGDKPGANVKLQTNLTPLQTPARGLVRAACNAGVVQVRNSPVEAPSSIGKIQRRHASQSAAPLPPILKDASKKPLSTHTGSSHSRLPQLTPNKLPTGFKAQIKAVKRADDAFRETDHSETTRAWPMSSEERKAEAKRKEEARLLKEAKEKQAKDAQEAAALRHRQEQLRREAQAIERAEALALEQKIKELREKWMARFSASAALLERVTVQLDDIRTQIEKLLDQCEAARRIQWEKKAEMIEMAFDKMMEEKELYGQLFAKNSQSSTSLCTAIGEFCTAVGEDVHGARLATLVNDLNDFDRNDFLPRYMFAEGDTPHRTAHLCAIFWMYSGLKGFEDGMQAEAHIWRHLRSARITHALHPEAFAYKVLYADWYCRTQRFVNGTNAFCADYHFWNNHTEFVKPPVFSRQRRDNIRPDVNARTTRRNDLVYISKEMAKDISRDLSRIFDRGNFVLGHNTTNFNRQQQIALRKPFTLVLEQVRETEHLVGSFALRYRGLGSWRGEIDKFIGDMKRELRLVQMAVRTYFRELDVLTLWNWLATERHIPQKRMNYRKISQPGTIKSDSPENDFTSAFDQIGAADQTWRYINFRGPHGQQVIVDYCVSYEFAERTAKLFTNNRVIGIDLWGGRRFENVEDAVREGNSSKRCIPMVAIANEERIALFHLASMRFDHYHGHLPTLVQILEDPAIRKVGENIQAFRQRLLTYMHIDMDGAVDSKSMYAGSSRSSQKDTVVDPDAPLGTRSRPYAVYPPEPRTTMTLSDQLRKHVGQLLRDDTVNCEDLQTDRIYSPKLIQLSASRPYAALQLHHILEQRMQTDIHHPSALSMRPRESKVAEISLSQKPANEDECASFNKIEVTTPDSCKGRSQRIQDHGSAVAEHDLGPTNIDPWADEGFRDYRLEKLAMALAKIVQVQTEGITPINHLAAYVLLTRFGQSCEDIYRILHIQEPADAILELVETTDLPLSETMLTHLKAEKESMEGSSSNTRATKWIKKIIVGAPVLLRMYRRSPQVRTEFEAYAMWHRLEMSVADIAKLSGKPRIVIFRLINKTLKLGRPPVFPFQRARYSSLLREYAPEDYAKEQKHIMDEVSPPLAPWGATMDVLSTSGLDSFDEGDLVRYTTRLGDGISPRLSGGTKQLNFVNEAKAPKAIKTAKNVKPYKTLRVPKTVKAAKTVKQTSTIRLKVLPTVEASRPKKKTRRVSSTESGSTVQHGPANPSEAPTRGLKERVSGSTVPKKGVTPKTRIAGAKKKKTDSGDSDWLQAMSVWTQTKNSPVDPDIAKIEDPVENPKLCANAQARRMRRRQAAKSHLEKSSSTKANVNSQTEKISYDGGEWRINKHNSKPTAPGIVESLQSPGEAANVALRAEKNTKAASAMGPPNQIAQTQAITLRKYVLDDRNAVRNQSEKSEGRSLDADVRTRKIEMEAKHDRNTTKTKTPGGQPLDSDLRFSMKKVPKPLSELSASDLRLRGSLRVEPPQELKLPKGAIDLSTAVE